MCRKFDSCRGHLEKKPNHIKKQFEKSPILGAHLSIAKGLHDAIYSAQSIRCNTLQIFTKNSSAWKEKSLSEKQIADFKKAKKETGIGPIASHTSYLINPAGPQKKKHSLSRNALKQELIRSNNLGIDFVVLHPGSHMGKGEAHGLDRIAETLNKIFKETSGLKTKLLLETSSGQGASIGHTFKHLSIILKKIMYKKRVGICLDTCHIFAAGYDIRTKSSYKKTMNEFDGEIGLKNLKLIHLNDSKKPLGSKVDRHEHIGKGKIGIDAFKFIMNDPRLSDIPKIIETPKEYDGKEMDIVNLDLLKKLMSSNS